MTISNQTPKLNIKEIVVRNLSIIFEVIDKEFDVKVTETSSSLSFDIKTKQSELFLANNGEILNDLQHIVRLMTHQQNKDDRTHFTIDIDGFRKKRHDAMCKAIPELVSQKVIKHGQTLVILGLNAYERYIIHSLLSEIKGIQSFGVGMGNKRRLVIMSSSETGTSGVDNAEIIQAEEFLNSF